MHTTRRRLLVESASRILPTATLAASSLLLLVESLRPHALVLSLAASRMLPAAAVRAARTSALETALIAP